MVGSLLAVPVGIASAYSFYRANFSPETTCQSLRSGIVAMLDKSVDAATRRMLVRRDVETFEKTCAAVDPEATAAFKALLAIEKTAAPAASVPVAPKVQHVETASKEPVRKAEPRPQAIAKQPVTISPPVSAEAARREGPESDSQWLDAVRQALVTHKPDVPPKAETSPAGATKELPAAVSPAPAPAAVPRDAALPEPAPVVSAPASSPIAPPLPPAIAVTPPPAQRVDVDHPVPPGSIPDSAPAAEVDIAKPEEHGRSRIGKWISAIPLLGPVVDNARH
jgi:hypothetical protein